MKKSTALVAIPFFALALIGAGCTQKTPAETPQPVEPEPQAQEETVETSSVSETTHRVNLTESKLTWAGEKITGAGHTGLVQVKSGSITLDENKNILAGEFTFDMNSIVCTDLEGPSKDSLEDHLKNEDFFDVANHPEGSFVITSVEKSDTGFNITGDLTLKDITNSVSFPATLDSSDDGTVLSTASVTIDRTLWNIKFGSGKFFPDLGDKLIKDEIEISLEITAEQV